MKLFFETSIDLPFLAIKSKFNQDLFIALKPPIIKLLINRFDGCSVGDEIHLELNTMGNTQKWVSVISEARLSDKEWSFTDEGKVIPWPLASWKHEHRVVSSGDNSAIIVDDINFQCVYSWLNIFFYPVLWCTFAIRPDRYKKYFAGA